MSLQLVADQAVFPTRLATFQVHRPLLAAAVRDQVLDAAARLPSVERGEAVGGWQSAEDLLEWSAETRQVAQVLVDVLSTLRPDLDGLHLVAWANVLRAGDVFSPHRHAGSAWSGAWYLDVGDGPGGHLVLEDPRAGAGVLDSPLLDQAEGAALSLAPQTGTLVVFPGWLLHHVTPYAGDLPRISLSFNAW